MVTNDKDRNTRRTTYWNQHMFIIGVQKINFPRLTFFRNILINSKFHIKVISSKKERILPYIERMDPNYL